MSGGALDVEGEAGSSINPPERLAYSSFDFTTTTKALVTTVALKGDPSPGTAEASAFFLSCSVRYSTLVSLFRSDGFGWQGYLFNVGQGILILLW